MNIYADKKKFNQNLVYLAIRPTPQVIDLKLFCYWNVILEPEETCCEFVKMF